MPLKDVGGGQMVLTFNGKCEFKECTTPTMCSQTIDAKTGTVIREFKPRFCEKHGIYSRFR